MRACANTLLLLATAGGILSPLTAVAEWNYRGGIHTAWQQFSEREDGQKLVEETGLMAGFAGTAGYRAGAWTFGVQGDYLQGKLDYDGATQGGASLKTDTEWDRQGVGGFVSHRLRGPVPAEIGGLIEYQLRRRSIVPTDTAAGLREDYRAAWLGLRTRLTLHRTTSLTLDVACAIDSSVEVRFDTTFDPATLTPKDHCRAGLAASVDLLRVGDRTLFFQPFADWERYAQTARGPLTAEGREVGTVYLPESRALRFGLTIGMRGSR